MLVTVGKFVKCMKMAHALISYLKLSYENFKKSPLPGKQ